MTRTMLYDRYIIYKQTKDKPDLYKAYKTCSSDKARAWKEICAEAYELKGDTPMVIGKNSSHYTVGFTYEKESVGTTFVFHTHLNRYELNVTEYEKKHN